MVRLTFDVYDPEQPEPRQTTRLAWGLLYQMVSRHPAGDQQQTRCGGKMLEGLEAIGIRKTIDGNESITMREEGGSILIESAEFELLKTALKKGRENVLLQSHRCLRYLDEAIETAEKNPVQVEEKDIGGEGATEQAG